MVACKATEKPQLPKTPSGRFNTYRIGPARLMEVADITPRQFARSRWFRVWGIVSPVTIDSVDVYLGRDHSLRMPLVRPAILYRNGSCVELANLRAPPQRTRICQRSFIPALVRSDFPCTEWTVGGFDGCSVQGLARNIVGVSLV